MEIIFYPLDFEYKTKDQTTLVYMYGKLDDGKKVCVVDEYAPYFYVKIEGVELTNLTERLHNLEIKNREFTAKVVSWKTVEKELLGKKEQFLKIKVNYPQSIPIISKELNAWGLEAFEKDILFIHCYLRDKEIIPMTKIKVEGTFVEDDELKIKKFIATKIKQESQESIKKLKYLAIDIETYSKNKEILPEKNPILMVALYGVNEKEEKFKKVITWKKFNNNLDYLVKVNDEVELLKELRNYINEYSPDIITGYFSDGFDFPYINIRATKHKVKLDLGIDGSELEAGNKTDFREGKSKIRGIVHIDIFKFIKYIFGKNLKTDGYSLDSVSSEILGSNKHGVDIAKLAEEWDSGSDKLEQYCIYNLQDSRLTYQLCEKLMPDMIEFCKILGLPIFDLTRMKFSKLVESYILERAKEYNVIAPNRPSREEIDRRLEETYQGGFVFEPKPGMYKDVVVFDFRSLYPTIITAHNIGPESLRCDCCKEKKVPGKEEYWFCTKKKSFISEVLERLVLRRMDLKKLIKESKQKNEETHILNARSYALKTLANSFYGYTGFFGARWYCLECAKSTTSYARNYIQETIKKAEENGFKTIYADTDSCFLLLENQSLEQAMEFMDKVNSNLPGHMELEYEGFYPRGIFVAIKGSSVGAKKKYALIDEKGEMKITGFETVRRNWSLLAKELQEKVLQLVLEDKVDSALEYVRSIIKELKEGKFPKEKLIIKTQITKELNSYSSIGPHVAVAMRMVDKGEQIHPGTVVEYIITSGSGLIREKAKLLEEAKNYDVDYYLNNQLLPAVSSIFLVLGYKEEDLLGEGKQEGLSKFF
jgi:DNA polymerase, archaea type